MIGLAPSWWFIVAANLLLAVNQGLAWSMTVVMKIDLAGPGAALITGVGLLVSIFLVRDTGAHVALGQRAHGDDAPAHSLRSDLTHASLRDPVLRACNQAGLVNNLNDALAWGPVPLYLAAHGTGIRQIAVVAAAYRIVWGAGHLATGWLSDHIGRKPLITGGMLVQAGAVARGIAEGLFELEAERRFIVIDPFVDGQECAGSA